MLKNSHARSIDMHRGLNLLLFRLGRLPRLLGLREGPVVGDHLRALRCVVLREVFIRSTLGRDVTKLFCTFLFFCSAIFVDSAKGHLLGDLGILFFFGAAIFDLLVIEFLESGASSLAISWLL
uniref:Uncharacterized protein n=1 Tax=Favella ehrenbergii TaxID=182087 RepID=A0A7S3I5Y8_9SPIT